MLVGVDPSMGCGSGLLIVAACSRVSRPSRLRRCPRSAGSLDTHCARCGVGGALAQRVIHTESIMTLKIYAVVLELVRKLSPYLPALRARSSTLGDQLERALVSIPLNLAEGAYSRGRNRQARYQSAAASAREALACLETAGSARLGAAAAA